MPLTIVQVATSFSGWGPDECHILELSEHLQRRGHRVIVACRSGRWIEQQSKRMMLQSKPFAVMRQQDTRDLLKLARFFRTQKVDVVHVHAHGDYVVPALAAYLARVPVRVMTGHHAKKLSNANGARIYSDLLYTHVIAVSNFVREVLIDSGMTANRVGVIPYGVEVDTPRLPDKSSSRTVPLLVGIVGRIASDKGHFDLVEAAHSLHKKYNLRYNIIGSGPDDDALRYQIINKGLRDLFSFTGFCSDMDSLIDDLDIVVAPTSSPHTCCAVIQKAMMLGKPVIGSRCGGNKELIIDGKTGLLIPPRSASKLAAAIARLAGNEHLRTEMSASAREHAITHYTIEYAINRIDALYQMGLHKQPMISPVKGLMHPL